MITAMKILFVILIEITITLARLKRRHIYYKRYNHDDNSTTKHKSLMNGALTPTIATKTLLDPPPHSPSGPHPHTSL